MEESCAAEAKFGEILSDVQSHRLSQGFNEVAKEEATSGNFTNPAVDSVGTYFMKKKKSALMRRTEELAQAILGVSILRSLFLDLLGRPRNSAAATAYRHRCDELTPNKYREYPKKWASFVLWGLALLSFMCCVTSFCALMSRDASASPSIFGTWFAACALYIGHDIILIQTSSALFVSLAMISFFKHLLEGTRREIVRAGLRLWRKIGADSEEIDLTNEIGTAINSQLGGLYRHLFTSFRLAKAHPFLFEAGLVECVDKDWEATVRRYVEGESYAWARATRPTTISAPFLLLLMKRTTPLPLTMGLYCQRKRMTVEVMSGSQVVLHQ